MRRSKNSLPSPLEGDPYGDKDKLEVEPEAALLYVKHIVLELLLRRGVILTVNLSQTRESRMKHVKKLEIG